MTVYWHQEAGLPDPAPALRDEIDADVVIVGGGYAGLWTAWALHERAPQATVAVLEARRCGEGPSGRNAGFLNSLWNQGGVIADRFGDEAARRICSESEKSVDAIGAWARDRGIDIWYRRAGHYKVAASAAQEGRWSESVEACARLGAPGQCRDIDAEQMRSHCDSPLFRRAEVMDNAASIQPARLALGLRDGLLEAGVALHEMTRVTAIDSRPGGVVVEAEGGGRVRAGSAVVAVNAGAAGFGPLRNSLVVSSTHMVLTEPVPDVLEEIGWTGGECISTARAYLHYMRTTPDGRIAFGWGGGRLACGARLGGRIEFDEAIVARVKRDLVTFFPQLRGRRVTHAWGGPVDVSPNRLPVIGTLPDGRTHYVYGFTGNGVGPAHFAGRILASLALDSRDELSSLALVDPAAPRVPPEPIRYFGGSIVRAALLRKDGCEDAGLAVDPLTELIVGLPSRLGIRVGR